MPSLGFFHRFRPKTLLDSVALTVMALVIVQLLALGLVFSQMIFEIVEKQTEKRALQTAKLISLLPELRHPGRVSATDSPLPGLLESVQLEEKITELIIRDQTGTVIFSSNRLDNDDRTTSTGITRVLRHGRTALAKAQSPEGLVILAHAPIFDADLDVVGVVSIGYLVDNLRSVTQVYLERELFYIWLFISLGLIVAIVIARRVKAATFGLEPKEIATLFQEREAIIASIREGVIATSEKGQVIMINQTAKRYLGSLAEQSLDKIFTGIDFHRVYAEGKTILDEETRCAGTIMILNVVPILRDAKISGAVVTFRRKDEIDLITSELAQIQTYSDLLRAQTHEYDNRLHAIVGMLEMEAYAEVLDFIAEETTGRRLLIRQLTEAVPDPTLSSFLIGKYMHAQELKIDFVIDTESHMTDIPATINRHQLVTILGNVINNAFDAALEAKTSPRVRLFMTDYGHDLLFEIEDSGHGVADDMVEHIFTRGISTKPGDKRGYGLHLVSTALKNLNGGISVQRSELGGARFVIEIPKRQESS